MQAPLLASSPTLITIKRAEIHIPDPIHGNPNNTSNASHHQPCKTFSSTLSHVCKLHMSRTKLCSISPSRAKSYHTDLALKQQLLLVMLLLLLVLLHDMYSLCLSPNLTMSTPASPRHHPTCTLST
jgi:hypothetical protein